MEDSQPQIPKVDLSTSAKGFKFNGSLGQEKIIYLFMASPTTYTQQHYEQSSGAKDPIVHQA